MPSLDLSDAPVSPVWRARMLLAAVVLSLLGNVYLVTRCNQLEERIAADSAATGARIRSLVQSSRGAYPTERTQGRPLAAEPQALPDSQIAKAGQ